MFFSLSFYGVIHLTGLVRKAGAAATPPPPQEIIGAAASRNCHSAPARQPDLTAASRIGDGGAVEGSGSAGRLFHSYGPAAAVSYTQSKI